MKREPISRNCFSGDALIGSNKFEKEDHLWRGFVTWRLSRRIERDL
jgi:hypothetical protein